MTYPQPYDPVLSSDAYKQAFAHYLVQGATQDEAHVEAYRWAATQLAAPPAYPPPPGVVVNSQANAYGGGPTVRTVKLSGGAHTLHLVLTICSCGLWAPVWIVHAILSRRSVRY